MAEVDWNAKYDINIINMEADTVFHLAAAFKDYLSKIKTHDEDVKATFEEAIEICNHICEKDDED